VVAPYREPSKPASEEASREELHRKATAEYAMRARVARVDVNEFIEFIMRHERTGEPIRQSPMHEEWHRLASKHKRIVLWGHLGSGKTQQMAIGRTLWLLGRNPAWRVLIVANVWDQAVKILCAIAGYIERNAALHAVFPNLKPGHPWTPDGGSITVDRDAHSKDPSVQAFGVTSLPAGPRIDHLVLDDILNFENTRTPEGMRLVYDRLESALFGRLEHHAHAICIGNAYHYDDAMHRLEKNPGWHAKRFPLVDGAGRTLWPAEFPQERVDDLRTSMHPIEFARQMMCQPRDDATARFKRVWIDICLKRGNGRSMAFGIDVMPPGCKAYTGVDLAGSKKSAADLTALCSILVHPNGDREVLCVESARLSGPEIVARIKAHHDRYQSIVIVESNAAQAFIVHFTQATTAVPVRPFTTGANKVDPAFGIESLAAEMANGKWIIPSLDGLPLTPEVSALIDEMLFYSPDKHTGDHLMAAWFAREGARMGAQTVEFGRVNWNRR